MADTKISDLTSYTPPLDADVFPVVDVLAGTSGTKKVTWANIKATLNSSLSFLATNGSGADLTNVIHPTGAESMADKTLTNTAKVVMDTSPAVEANVEGTLIWNATDKCLDVYDGATKCQVGQEVYVIAHNETGVEIENGRAVYIVSSVGARPTIALAKADNVTTADTILGITTQSIAHGAEGKVTISGLINNLDTSSFVAGATVYLSTTTAGEFTSTLPVAPYYTVHMGHVIVSSATVGSILSDPLVETQQADTVFLNAGTGVAEMNNVQDFFKHSWSTGITEGCAPTSDGAGGLNIASGEALIRLTDADDAELKPLVVAAATSLALTTSDVNYIYFTQSGGVISWNVTTDRTIFDGITKVIAFIVSRDGNTLNILDLTKVNVDGNRKNRRQKFEFDGRVYRGIFGSSLGLSTMSASGLNILVSTGRQFHFDNVFTQTAFDTTVGGASLYNNFFIFTNRTSYAKSAATKAISATVYDNAGTPTDMGSNKWRRDDWFVVLGDSPYIAQIRGNNEAGSEAAAIAFGFPATLPPMIDGAAMYLGYSTIQKNAVAPTFYNFAGTSSFAAATTITENELLLSDVTTNDVSSTKHGLMPKLGTALYVPRVNSGATAIEYVAPTGTVSPVFSTSPTLVTPILGEASATSLVTTGNIELGHATDTTISRVSAGVVAIESSNILTAATGLALAGGTMTGKTVPAGTAEVAKTYTPATGAQTVALDCLVNNIHEVTGHASGTAITFTVANATNSQCFMVAITQGAVVSTITGWFATVRWVGGTTPTLTATVNKRDVFGFRRTGTNTYDGFIIGQNL